MKNYFLFFVVISFIFASCKKENVPSRVDINTSPNYNIGQIGPSDTVIIGSYSVWNPSNQNITVYSVNLQTASGSIFSGISYRFVNSGTWTTFTDDLSVVLNKILQPGESTIPFNVRISTLSRTNGYIPGVKVVFKIRTISTNIGEIVPASNTEISFVL